MSDPYEEMRDQFRMHEELHRVRQGLEWGTDTPPLMKGNVLSINRNDQKWSMVVKDISPAEEGGFNIEGRVMRVPD